MSALIGTGALALWLDVAPHLDRETDGWYVDEHLPERVDIGGYARARRYCAELGEPRYFSLFEAETPQALASEGYMGLVKRISAQSQRIRDGFSNVVRNTFMVRSSCGRGVGAVMGSWRVRLEGGDAGSAIAHIDRQAAQWLRWHGVVGVHWLQAVPEVRACMDAVRVTGHADAGADYVLLVEATRSAEVMALREGPLSTAALVEQGWGLDGFGLYRLLYEVSGQVAGNERKLGDRI